MTSLSFPLYSVTPPADQAGERFDRRSAMDNDNETVGGYAVPVDPMDMLQCESCQ
ncbi:hypothetical protein [Yonghaparkia sp. Root332]|uniref:hypothetical protein n=1 Tax=Yonghaparkia sp. Root332 TaxID=1736516 RepID=UPI001F17139F|nr:hypothetical protein [Yonghaparkia sp. Root332]